ncbi:MAG: phosphatase PAP2 family protein [Bacteroidales bacterium]|nr:phosphatase PAP2 family protein [Bacteroidales bacterium]
MDYFSSISNLSLMQSLQKLDIGILKGIFENRIPGLDIVFIFITNSAGAIAFGAPILLLLIALKKKIPGLRREALTILIPVALSAILANILKYIFDTPRPYEVYSFIHKLSVGGSPSFPSGHTADAFAFAVAMALVYRKWYSIIPVLIWAALVGYSRMYLGVHFPSDVIGGAFIGAACSYGYVLYAKRKFLKSPKTNSIPDSYNQ